MTKSQRLKPITEIAESHEQDAARSMGERQQYLAGQYARLEEIKAYRAEYVQRMQEAGACGIEAGQMQDYTTFIRRLDEAIVYQYKQISAAEQHLDMSKSNWQALHSRSEALNKVVDRLRDEERRQDDRREQKETDDRSQRYKNIFDDF